MANVGHVNRYDVGEEWSWEVFGMDYFVGVVTGGSIFLLIVIMRLDFIQFPSPALAIELRLIGEKFGF